jgi:hypothetical protein
MLPDNFTLEHAQTRLWDHRSTNMFGMGCDGKDGGGAKITDRSNDVDNPSNTNQSLTRTVEARLPGILDPCESQTKEEMEAAILEHFKTTMRREPEGRYKVSLPWLYNREELPDNSE